jgi:hypothetical protein
MGIISIFNIHGKNLLIKLLTLFLTLNWMGAHGQIFQAEGLNLPGAWNGWTNPPSDNLALASATQVTNGRVTKIATGITRWQTIFSVAASGGDIVGGNYNWLFTSGPTSNAFANKWAGATVTINTLQNYTYNTGADNNITLTNGKWYTMNWKDNGYADAQAIFMETSAQPVNISNVTSPATVNSNTPATITITLSAAKSAEEIVYLRYTTNGWTNSSLVVASFTGTNGTAQIPGQPNGTGVSYYVFSSTVASITGDYDLYTIKLNNNGGSNYTYAVGDPVISWANLQAPASGTIAPSSPYNVYAQALIPGLTGQATPAAGLQAWIGYSTTNTNPNTWTNWVAAPYYGIAGNNDEFMADLGSQIATEGTYYYASRFKLGTGSYVYGGYSATGGGFWDGTTNISGQLTVAVPDIDWCNLQYPSTGSIAPQQDFMVFGQAWIDGITGSGTSTPGLNAWVGYSTTNTNPNTWTNWIAADFNTASGNNDEFQANLGVELISDGTYYFAYRYKYLTNDYVYGGFSSTGGGFWDGTANVSGMVTVTTPPPAVINWANLQSPESATIVPGDQLFVYGQAWIENLTGTGTQTPGLEAWIGYSTENSNPDTWTNWIAASFNGPAGNNDEFYANLGAEIASNGTYYYATRFSYNNGDYLYGGWSASGGGFWDGTTNVNGILTASTTVIPINWANLQWPDTGNIAVGDSYLTYAQTWIDGVTGQSGQTPGLQCWIGLSSLNTDPSTWNTWIEASYNQAVGNNDEFMTDMGSQFTTQGTYYYASRFQYLAGEYVYGGYSETGGGFWDGTNNVSGVVTVILDGIYDPGSNLSVFPNPVINELYISGRKNQKFSLFNISGQTLFEGTLTMEPTILNMKGVAPGAYYLKIADDQTTISRVIIKQ